MQVVNLSHSKFKRQQLAAKNHNLDNSARKNSNLRNLRLELCRNVFFREKPFCKFAKFGVPNSKHLNLSYQVWQFRQVGQVCVSHIIPKSVFLACTILFCCFAPNNILLLKMNLHNQSILWTSENDRYLSGREPALRNLGYWETGFACEYHTSGKLPWIRHPALGTSNWGQRSVFCWEEHENFL